MPARFRAFFGSEHRPRTLEPWALGPAPQSAPMQILKGDRDIRSVDDWFRLAPPVGGIDQWRLGRSALECAVAWCGNAAGPGVPAPGEPRNCDFVAVAEGRDGRVAISIEAKADEPFDRPIQEVIADVIDRTSHGANSNALLRVEQLSAALLPKRERGLSRLGGLRY